MVSPGITGSDFGQANDFAFRAGQADAVFAFFSFGVVEELGVHPGGFVIRRIEGFLLCFLVFFFQGSSEAVGLRIGGEGHPHVAEVVFQVIFITQVIIPASPGCRKIGY